MENEFRVAECRFRYHNEVLSLLTISVLLTCLTVVLFCSGCAQDESLARQYISSGIKTSDNISASSSKMGTEIINLTGQVFQGMSLDELKSRVASLDNDLAVIKDALGKANTEYSKVLDLRGVPDWVKDAKNLMRADDIVMQIYEKGLATFHSYISSVEAGASPDFHSISSRYESDLSQMTTEYNKVRKEAADFSKQHSGE